MEFLRPRFYSSLCYGIRADKRREMQILCLFFTLFLFVVIFIVGVWAFYNSETTFDEVIAYLAMVIGTAAIIGALYGLWKICAPVIRKARLEVSIPNVGYRRKRKENNSEDDVSINFDHGQGPPPYASHESDLGGAVGGVDITNADIQNETGPYDRNARNNVVPRIWRETDL